jgi:hypothetical protein
MARPTFDKTPQKSTFKPLSIEQENAIDLLIAGHTDQQVADAIGKDRTTIWGWRHEHPLFMATLARRRAEVWRAPQEKLRALLSKAVENLAAAVEAGDMKVSIEVLKAVGMYGDGTMNAIGEQEPERLLHAQAQAQLTQEGIPRDEHEMLGRLLETRAYRDRLEEITAHLRRTYLE